MMPCDDMTTEVMAVPLENEGSRLDKFLALRFPEKSRAFFQRGIESHWITLNGKPTKAAERLHAQDQIRICWPPEKKFEITAENVPFAILFEDDDLLVVNKPPAMVVHPARGNWSGTLVHGLFNHDPDSFAAMSEVCAADEARPGIVHRLDKDTSGALVIAKNQDARVALGEAFADRRVQKTYLALVRGILPEAPGRLETLIGRHPVNRQRMAVVKPPRRGKNAITNYRVLWKGEKAALLEVGIETGRTHQIRVHLAHIRCPVLGDCMYGGSARDFEFEVPRQMLHAWRIVFPHPRSGAESQFIAPLPDDFREILRILGCPEP